YLDLFEWTYHVLKRKCEEVGNQRGSEKSIKKKKEIREDLSGFLRNTKHTLSKRRRVFCWKIDRSFPVVNKSVRIKRKIRLNLFQTASFEKTYCPEREHHLV